MNGAISSLRILPAEAGTTSLRPATASDAGFRDVLHSAMIAVEKADLSFQLMMQVRNKIVSAYQEISRMQF